MNTIPFTAAGNLTRDPELRTIPSGAVAHLTLAITPQHKAQSGEWENGETTFIDASVWGAIANHVVECLHKGDRVVVLGRLVTRVFTPQSGANAGHEVRKLEVVADEIGPSLRWATATVTKPPATWAPEAPPEEEPF